MFSGLPITRYNIKMIKPYTVRLCIGIWKGTCSCYSLVFSVVKWLIPLRPLIIKDTFVQCFFCKCWKENPSRFLHSVSFPCLVLIVWSSCVKQLSYSNSKEMPFWLVGGGQTSCLTWVIGKKKKNCIEPISWWPGLGGVGPTSCLTWVLEKIWHRTYILVLFYKKYVL